MNRSATRLCRGFVSAAAAVLLAILASPMSAAAAPAPTPTPAPTPPPSIPGWYSTAIDPEYVPNGAPWPVLDEEFNKPTDFLSRLHMTYWSTQGRSPGDGEPVGEITVVAKDSSFAEILLESSAFVSEMGTIVDVFTPAEFDGETTQFVGVELSGPNTILVSRPALSSVCDLADPAQYRSVPVVVLTEGYRKYLLMLDVTFGDRTADVLKHCAKGITQAAKPTVKPSATATPRATATPAPEPSEVEVAAITEAPEKEASTDKATDSAGGVLPILGIGVVLLIVIAAVTLKRRGKASADEATIEAVKAARYRKQSKYGR